MHLGIEANHHPIALAEAVFAEPRQKGDFHPNIKNKTHFALHFVNINAIFFNPNLVLMDFGRFRTPQYCSTNTACSHVYQIHQTPTAAFVGFSTSQYSPV